jgi:CrcB protein
MSSVLAICIGACLGALSRWGLSLWLNGVGILPWGTVAANLAGGWLVGLAVALFQAMPQLDPAWRLLAITGFLGALTTFSTFSAEVVGMLQEGQLALAMGTAVLHLAGSLLLTALGLKCGAWLFGA